MVARGKKLGTFYVNASCRNMIAIADDSMSSGFWNYRFGHMSKKRIKMLHSDWKLQGLKEVELVHTEIWGPSIITSLGGSNYYVTFIDD